jgi:hypothetical protein
MIGSALFAAGVVIDVLLDEPQVAGWTFFAGSLFFTGAAALQWVSSRREVEVPEGEDVVARLRVRARNADWSAAAIQFLGTLLFNINTWRAATLTDLSATEANRLVWTPDALGSVLFLVSSAIAFLPEVRKRRHTHVRSSSWAIGALNFAGSVFFGVSAIGALTLPADGSLVDLRWANLGTFLGALCFFVGALLLARGPAGRPNG